MMDGMMDMMHGWGLLVALLVAAILVVFLLSLFRRPARGAAVLAAFGASLLLGACSPSPENRGARPAPGSTATPNPAGSPATQYPIRGKVEAVAPDGRAVTLDHEDIPGLMAGMTMEFKVADPASTSQLKAGDRVSGTLELRSGDYVIVALTAEKAPAK